MVLWERETRGRGGGWRESRGGGRMMGIDRERGGDRERRKEKDIEGERVKLMRERGRGALREKERK